MNKPPPFLSKSKYLEGLRCPKLLWYKYNRKQEIPPPSLDLEEIFKQGRIVGEMAQKLFPGGIKVKRDWSPVETNRRSVKALAERKPLFEAGFTCNHGYALADILVPVGKDQWDLIEVKSSSSVKEQHYHDAAFQRYVYEGAGVKIRGCYIMYLNRDYVRKGEVEPDKLFKKDDITIEAMELVPDIEKNIEGMLKRISGTEPKVKVHPECKNCPLESVCWSFLPEDHVFILRGNKKIAYDLMERGILKIEDIPKDYELNEKHRIQVKSHKEKQAYIDKRAIKDFIKKLKYPLYFLDFETIAPAIPVYDNTRPFEDVPFQFSLHVVKKEGAKPVHHSYLASGEIDPRPELLEQLKKLLGDSGAIVAYAAQYEQKCLRHAVRAYPKYNQWFVGIKKRFLDLLAPFSNLLYYHPRQKGSASLKNVLPALTNINYHGMEIMDGAAARYGYMRITFEKAVDEKERKRVREALEKYCELDTLGMVEIIKALKEQIS